MTENITRKEFLRLAAAATASTALAGRSAVAQDAVSTATAIEAIFAARSTEQEWNTAARLQTDLFGDGSAPLKLARGPPVFPLELASMCRWRSRATISNT